MQALFALRSRQAEKRTATDRSEVEIERWICAFLRPLRSIFLFISLVLYAVDPDWFGVLSVPLPAWIQWLGIALGIFSLALYAWSRSTLGKEWSSPLQMQTEHHLVTTGPYARIRHPIYLALLGFLASLALVSANWCFIVVLAFSIVDLSLRMPREEQMMIGEFGEEYEDYMEKTGRLFPRL